MLQFVRIDKMQKPKKDHVMICKSKQFQKF